MGCMGPFKLIFFTLDVSCKPVWAPLHGRMDGSSFFYEDVVIFSCDLGYVLVGSSRLRCGAAGVWLGHVPTCEGSRVSLLSKLWLHLLLSPQSNKCKRG